MGHIVAVGKIRVINITPRYATLTYCAKYVSGGIDVNLGILIKLYWDTVMYGYRYGDGPDDSWNGVWPNGSHQNKSSITQIFAETIT